MAGTATVSRGQHGPVVAWKPINKTGKREIVNQDSPPVDTAPEPVKRNRNVLLLRITLVVFGISTIGFQLQLDALRKQIHNLTETQIQLSLAVQKIAKDEKQHSEDVTANDAAIAGLLLNETQIISCMEEITDGKKHCAIVFYGSGRAFQEPLTSEKQSLVTQ